MSRDSGRALARSVDGASSHAAEHASQLRSLAADLVFSIQEVDILLAKMARVGVSEVAVSELWSAKQGLADKLGSVHDSLLGLGATRLSSFSASQPGSRRTSLAHP